MKVAYVNILLANANYKPSFIIGITNRKPLFLC